MDRMAQLQVARKQSLDDNSQVVVQLGLETFIYECGDFIEYNYSLAYQTATEIEPKQVRTVTIL